MPTLTLIIELTVVPKHFRQIFLSFHEKSMKFWLHFKKKTPTFRIPIGIPWPFVVFIGTRLSGNF